WMGKEEHIALRTMHHIISDGWSMGVLTGEIRRLYSAFVQGEPSPLKELAIQYADYAYWQRQWLQEEALGRQLSYWKKALDGAPQLLELPTDHPRLAAQDDCGASRGLRLSEPLSQRIRELSQEQGVTLFMTLLAAFQTLLARY